MCCSSGSIYEPLKLSILQRDDEPLWEKLDRYYRAGEFILITDIDVISRGAYCTRWQLLFLHELYLHIYNPKVHKWWQIQQQLLVASCNKTHGNEAAARSIPVALVTEDRWGWERGSSFLYTCSLPLHTAIFTMCNFICIWTRMDKKLKK